MTSTLIFWFFLATLTSQAAASHFRGGIITWKPHGYISNKVVFNFRLGFRRSYSYSYFCDSSMVAQQSIVGSGDTWTASHDRGYYSSRTVADTGYHCTDFSVNEDWTQGENTFNYNFPDEGPWLVSYSSCCWISLTNGGHGNWFLSTTVNLTRRQDNGKINSSPISALSPIVRIQQGCPRIISIPAEDSDGDKVRCRWSSGSSRECGGVCKRFVYSGTLDEERCTLRVHSNVALGWHAVAITLEDYPKSTTNFHMATPFSHVSLQFLVHVASNAGPCNRAPVLIGQTPNGGSCEEVSDGDTFYSVIEAKHIDSSRRIAEIITVTPLYMNVTSLLNYTDHVGDTVYYKNVSWTPKSSQKGRHIFCFKAMDEYGMESDERCITILVGSNNTPRPILSSRTPVTPTLSWPWGYGFVDFHITFDQQIKKPRHSKFIEIVLEDHVIYKLDTRSSSDVTIDRDRFTLRFRLPQAVLSTRGNYSVTMDRGAVVGLGCTSDGPPTPGLSSIKSWTFDVGVCSKGTFIDQSYSCNDVDECSNPLPIQNHKKKNPWSWYYSSAQGILATAIPASTSPYDFSPTPASSVSVASTVSVSGSCPYYTNQQNGRFTSPNYPSNYWDNAYCSLLIEAPRSHFIYIQFKSFDLEHGCDYVEIFDGNSAGSRRIAKAWGREAPCGVYSSGRFLFVQFRSDGSVRRSGFSATFHAVAYSYNLQQASSSLCSFFSPSSLITSMYPSPAASHLSPTPGILATVIPASTSPYDFSPTPASSISVASTVSVSGSCPYYTNQQNGRFTSPNYPSNFWNNAYCSLLIEAPRSHFIYIQFKSFDLEHRYDYVEIFDGNSAGSRRIAKAWGREAPCVVYSSGRFLFVQFRSDGSVRRSGFSATFHAVAYSYNLQQASTSSCSFFSSSSLITSMYPSPAASHLSPTPGILATAIPASTSPYDFSPTPASSVSIASTVSVSGSCPYYTNQQNGRFTSPNYPSNYRDNAYCSLLIEAPRSHFIYIQFKSFDLEHGCDYVEIFDGYSAGSRRIAKAWGREAPCGVYSSGRFLFVQFRSDGSVRRSGFSATFHSVAYSYNLQQASSLLCSFFSSSSFITSMYPSPAASHLSPTPASSAAIKSSVSVSGYCSYYLNQNYGRFTSPNYPWNYPNNQHCTWVIEAPRGYYIYLHFASFELEYCGNCACDVVEIFDGNSRWSPMIKRACDGQPPCGMYSSGRWLFVQFRSDGSVTYRGFSATYYVVSYNYGYSVYQSLNSGSTLWCNSFSTATKISSQRSISPTKSSLYVASTASTYECLHHSYLDDFVRGMGYYNGYYGYNQCDRYLRFGWYRFRGAAGTEMPTTCVGKNRCSTHAPGWLNGGHPSVADGIVHRTVCFHWSSSCCYWSKNIRVRNCGGFYVYELGPPPYCQSRYCGNGGANYSTPNVTSMPTSQESFTRQSTPAMLSWLMLSTSSPTSSVNIQASTASVMPIASRVPFVLHLPAQCLHNCVNTWGSYYCTCRQGYKLEADGKTCLDIDECQTQNGGCTHQCINTPGSHYCKCREGATMGFDNKTCHEPGINVKCTDEAMFIFLERKSFQGFDPSKLTLIYPSCRASYNDTHITLRTNLNDCGTTHNESEDTITFYNKVRSIEFSSGNVITRDQNMSIPFYCSYGRKAIVRNPSFKTWKNYVTSSEGGYGNFTFTMDMFKTSNYYTPYSYDDYPISVNLQDRLFIQIAVASFQSNLVVFADTCKATPSSDPYSVPQYIFLQRGCGLDSTLNYSYSIGSKQRFSIQAFRFIEDHPVVHLHCEVLACHRNTARSRCLQGCSRNRGRRDEKPGSESTQVYEMSSGPIRFQKKSKGKVDRNAEAQMNMATITAVGAAGGVCLLLAIALAVAVIHIKKRFKGALADRNKVYAMEQFSKYVKEENDNDGFAQDDDLNGPREQDINIKTSA